MHCHEEPFAIRPRERAMAQGIDRLSDLELVQAMLGSGTRNHPIHQLAGTVLRSLEAQVDGPDSGSLLAIPGIGLAKTTLLCSAMELARRLYHCERRRIRIPSDILPIIRHYGDRKQEYFLCLSLNGAHEVIRCRLVTIGLLNRTLVHPREVFADPLSDRASAVVVAHNHPSGNLEPSVEDVEITARLKQAGDILGIKLLDHLIFSDQGHCSLLERGLL